MHTTSTFYLRLHGNPVLFKSSYETADLHKFYEGIPEGSIENCIYFNNTYYEAGYENALLLRKIAGMR